MSQNGQYLPQGWAETTLGAIQLDLAVGISPAHTPEEMFELYSVPSHECGYPEIVKGKDIGSNKQTITPNTVLLCKINPRINRVWVTGNYSAHTKIASTEWVPFFPILEIEPRYLAYFLRQGTVRDFLARNASGVGGSLMRVRAATFRDFTFKVAPIAEQTRIADTLDEMFSDLEASVAALMRVREKLKLYRASVLKAAVEGMLTAEWRAQHTHTEPASQLLKRILAERRRRWEEDQLAKFKAKGQEPPKNWKAKYKEPVPLDTTNLPQLPEGWCWGSTEQICEFITKGTTPPGDESPQASGDIPFIKVQHLSGTGGFHFDDSPSFVSRITHEGFLARSKVFPGDVLMNIVGPPLGQVSIVPTNYMEWNINQAIAIFRVIGEIPYKYIAACLLSRPVLSQALRRTKTTAGQVNLTLEVCRTLAIPLPPLTEQEAIVEAVEDQLSVVDHLEAALDAKLQSARSLRQAILSHAFTGKLVPQDPNDEPASELLKRIAAEREARQHETAAKQAAKNSNGSRPPRRGRTKKNKKKDTNGRFPNW